MSGDSPAHFTVTLGRGGRVVQRSGTNSDRRYNDSESVSGRKRSIKDRLGAGTDYSFRSQSHDNHKRQRRESGHEIHNRFGSQDIHLERGDLRLKLLEKSNKDPPSNIDLRDMLSKKASRPPVENKGIRHPEHSVHARETLREQRDSPYGGRQASRDPANPYDGRRRNIEDPRVNHNNGRQRGMLEPEDHFEDGRRSMLERRDFYDDGRRTMMDPRDKYGDGRRSMLDSRDRYDDGRGSMLDSRDRYDDRRGNMLRPVSSSSRNAHDIPMMDRARNSHSSRGLDGQDVRRRSSDGIMRSSTSRVMSPERNTEELHRRTIVRPYDDRKPNNLIPSDVMGPPRAAGSSSLMMQPGIHAVPSKPMPQFVSQFPQPSGVPRKIPYPGEVLTVDGFLQSLGLEKYCINFKAEEVDMHALRQMSEIDLKELGIPLGPRKKILQALLPRPRPTVVITQTPGLRR